MECNFQGGNVLCLGAGYVGVITMTVFANYYPETKFILYDKYKDVIEKWTNSGNTLPIREKQLDTLFENAYKKNLFFCNSVEDLDKLDIVFICVNTPSKNTVQNVSRFSIEEIENEISKGIELNLSYVYSSVEELCEKLLKTGNRDILTKQRIIVQKSTVSIETLKNIQEVIINYFTKNQEYLFKILQENVEIRAYVSEYFRLVNIPEFLAEGSAVNNIVNPDRVIIGHLKGDNNSYMAAECMTKFYKKWISEEKIIKIDSNSSEMIKLVSNAFLAQRISSINSLSRLCETISGSIDSLSIAVGMDNRIGKNYLKASMGFGGSCLRKDTLSLIFILNSKGLTVEAEYWKKVILMNEYQRLRICGKIYDSITQYSNSPISIFGLAFKGDTNDARQSNAVFLISYLLTKQIRVNVYDPFVSEKDLINELKIYNQDVESSLDLVIFYNDYLECVKNTKTLVFCSGHSMFKTMNLTDIADNMLDSPAVFDLYDLFEFEYMKSNGFKVFKLGEFDDFN